MLTAAPLVISPEGEFDIYSQDRFAEALHDADAYAFVVLDFARVRYIDSTCITVLIRMQKRRLIAGQQPVHFAALTPILQRVFAIVGLDQAWRIFGTVQEARDAFRPH